MTYKINIWRKERFWYPPLTPDLWTKDHSEDSGIQFCFIFMLYQEVTVMILLLNAVHPICSQIVSGL